MNDKLKQKKKKNLIGHTVKYANALLIEFFSIC
jgi:hypothetical protein